jgi:hypothetical protein
VHTCGLCVYAVHTCGLCLIHMQLYFCMWV